MLRNIKKLQKHYYWWNNLSKRYYILHLIPFFSVFKEQCLPGFENIITTNIERGWQLIDCHGGLIKIRKTPKIIYGKYEVLLAIVDQINIRRKRKRGYSLITISELRKIEEQNNKSILYYSEKYL
jgi:hypothetical protein